MYGKSGNVLLLLLLFFRKCIYVTVPGIRIHVAHFFQNRVITTVAKSKC